MLVPEWIDMCTAISDYYLNLACQKMNVHMSIIRVVVAKYLGRKIAGLYLSSRRIILSI